jgi:hypothetical protein
MRKDKTGYSEFADYMVCAVHGKVAYAQSAGSKTTMFSSCIPVSQEAFALLLYKNGYNNWIWKNENGATSSDDSDPETEINPGFLYTNSNGVKGTAFTKRNNGWSEAGMQEFNKLCVKVKESRAADNTTFDAHYKTHWRATKCISKYKRRKVVALPAVVTIYDDLVDPDQVTPV